jgi:hypothetical protein
MDVEATMQEPTRRSSEQVTVVGEFERSQEVFRVVGNDLDVVAVDAGVRHNRLLDVRGVDDRPRLAEPHHGSLASQARLLQQHLSRDGDDRVPFSRAKGGVADARRHGSSFSRGRSRAG